MSIQATHIIGHSVFALNTGEKIDSVSDVIFDPLSQRVTALLIDSGGWFSDAKIVRIEDVHSIGDDSVIVFSPSAIKRAGEVGGPTAAIAHSNNHITHSKVITEDGNNLGEITNLRFDLPNGNVSEFEVSEGVIQDATSARKSISIADIITVGKDAIIVRRDVSQSLKEQAQHQGIQGMIHDAQESETAGKAKDQGQKATDYLQEKGKEVQDYVQSGRAKNDAKKQLNSLQEEAKNLQTQAQEGLEKAKDFISQKTDQSRKVVEDNRKQGALGKYLTANVVIGDNIVARRGEIITQSLMDQAEQHEILDTVLNNTSKEKPTVQEHTGA